MRMHSAIQNFADAANAGRVHYDARELKRRMLWAAFSEFDAALTAASSPEETCNKCNGTGRIEYVMTYHGARDQRFMDKCNKCGGSGKIPTPQTEPRRS
jgi:hypothetical protein